MTGSYADHVRRELCILDPLMISQLLLGVTPKAAEDPLPKQYEKGSSFFI
jgi:hypothetical protein